MLSTGVAPLVPPVWSAYGVPPSPSSRVECCPTATAIGASPVHPIQAEIDSNENHKQNTELVETISVDTCRSATVAPAAPVSSSSADFDSDAAAASASASVATANRTAPPPNHHPTTHHTSTNGASGRTTPTQLSHPILVALCPPLAVSPGVAPVSLLAVRVGLGSMDQLSDSFTPSSYSMQDADETTSVSYSYTSHATSPRSSKLSSGGSTPRARAFSLASESASSIFSLAQTHTYSPRSSGQASGTQTPRAGVAPYTLTGTALIDFIRVPANLTGNKAPATPTNMQPPAVDDALSFPALSTFHTAVYPSSAAHGAWCRPPVTLVKPTPTATATATATTAAAATATSAPAPLSQTPTRTPVATTPVMKSMTPLQAAIPPLPVEELILESRNPNRAESTTPTESTESEPDSRPPSQAQSIESRSRGDSEHSPLVFSSTPVDFTNRFSSDDSSSRSRGSPQLQPQPARPLLSHADGIPPTAQPRHSSAHGAAGGKLLQPTLKRVQSLDSSKKSAAASQVNRATASLPGRIRFLSTNQTESHAHTRATPIGRPYATNLNVNGYATPSSMSIHTHIGPAPLTPLLRYTPAPTFVSPMSPLLPLTRSLQSTHASQSMPMMMIHPHSQSQSQSQSQPTPVKTQPKPPQPTQPQPTPRLETIKLQLEYYFSPNNLARDLFLRQQMDGRGYVPVCALLDFPRLKSLTCRPLDLLTAAKASQYLQTKPEAIRTREWKKFVIDQTAVSQLSDEENDEPRHTTHPTIAPKTSATATATAANPAPIHLAPKSTNLVTIVQPLTPTPTLMHVSRAAHTAHHTLQMAQPVLYAQTAPHQFAHNTMVYPYPYPSVGAYAAQSISYTAYPTLVPVYGHSPIMSLPLPVSMPVSMPVTLPTTAAPTVAAAPTTATAASVSVSALPTALTLPLEHGPMIRMVPPALNAPATHAHAHTHTAAQRSNHGQTPHRSPPTPKQQRVRSHATAAHHSSAIGAARPNRASEDATDSNLQPTVGATADAALPQ